VTLQPQVTIAVTTGARLRPMKRFLPAVLLVASISTAAGQAAADGGLAGHRTQTAAYAAGHAPGQAVEPLNRAARRGAQCV